MLEVLERTCTAHEKEFLKNKIESYEQKLRSDLFVLSVSIFKGFLTSVIITGFSYFMPQYKLSPTQYLLLFLVVGIALSMLWIREALRTQGNIEDTIIKYNDVILTDSVVEQSIVAKRYIEVENEWKSKDCLLFELADKKTLLILEYSDALLFPTNEFSISSILDAKGNVIDYSLVGKEPVTEPCKKVILQNKTYDLIKGDWNMTILDCGLDDFETFLLQYDQIQNNRISR